MVTESEGGAVSMVTRCPSCSTLFRVTPQQLQAYRGQVRCGRCMTVFDGFSVLATLPDQGAPEPEPRPPAERAASMGHADGITAAVPPAPDAGRPEAYEATEPGAAAVAHAAPIRTAAARDALAPAELSEARATNPSPVPGQDAARTEEGADTSEAAPEIDAVPRSRRAARGWVLACGLLLLVLGGQAFYVYRVELAANYTNLKPIALGFCDLFGCTVPLPQRPKLITIEASDMQVQDPQRPSVIQLTATLRNHAGFEVGYPALDLVLTNTKEHTLARRIFMPEEYLERGRGARAGMPANAEVTVRLALDTGDLGAAGFRLALLPGR